MSADRKAVLTALGISLGASFAFLGLAIPESLDALSSSQPEFLQHRDDLVARPDGAAFDVPSSLVSRLALRSYAIEGALSNGTRVQLVHLAGRGAPDVPEGRYVANPPPPFGETPIEVAAPGTISLQPGIPTETRLVPRGWLLVSSASMQAIDPSYHDGRATSVLLTGITEAERQELAQQGFVVEPVPAIESFFRASGAEVAFDLVLVVAFSSVLVALFSYEFLRSEIHERRREVGLWRGIGLRSRDVAVLLIGRATAIAAAGTALGLLLSVVALAVGARLVQVAVLRVELSPARVALVFVALVLAGAVGGLVPAIAAARKTVRESLEAGV